MDIVENLKLKIQASLAKLGYDIPLSDIVIVKNKDVTHGDYSSNIAMKLAKSFGKTPTEVAELIVKNLEEDNSYGRKEEKGTKNKS